MLILSRHWIAGKSLPAAMTVIAVGLFGIVEAKATPVRSDKCPLSGYVESTTKACLPPPTESSTTSSAINPPPVRNTWHPFIAFEAGGTWLNPNFEVSPPFGVQSSGFVGGINGGVLVEIPETHYFVGMRLGWQGSNTSGTTSAPIASPFFDYTVKARSIFYQELMLQIPINIGAVEPKQFPRAYPFITASAGIAEAQTQFTGTSGAFQVTDSVTQTGFTGTVGIGMPINQTFLGGAVDVYAQYRLIVLPDTTVSSPGRVHVSSYKPQSVTLGFRYQW